MFCPLCNEKLLKDKLLYDKKAVMFCPSIFEWKTIVGEVKSHYEIYQILNIELIYIKPFHIINDITKNITRIYAFDNNPLYSWRFLFQSELIKASILEEKLLKLIKFI